MIKTALSHPNKALVIYWGNEDDTLRIPTRSSLSLTLEGINHALDYIVTLRTIQSAERDRVIIEGTEDKGEIYKQFVRHLDIMRAYTGFRNKVEVITRATFPIGSGLAGSAASASAVAEAFAGLVGKTEDRRLISIMARRGSGSASRSVFGGSVVWQKGSSDDSSYARQLFDEKHWDIRNVIAIVSSRPKLTSSIIGMQLSKSTCPESLYATFADAAEFHIEKIKSAIDARDIETLGAFYESENSLFRKICLNTKPSLDYWKGPTHHIINMVSTLRTEGVPAYAGTDAGPNVHVLTPVKHVERVLSTLQGLEGVEKLVHCKVGEGSHLIEDDLAWNSG